jgi:methionyl aminopeptidase
MIGQLSHMIHQHFEHTYTITPDGKIFVLTAEDGGKEQLARLGVEVSDLL